MFRLGNSAFISMRVVDLHATQEIPGVRCNLTLWRFDEDTISQLKEGAAFRIRNISVRQRDGCLQLNAGGNSIWTPISNMAQSSVSQKHSVSQQHLTRRPCVLYRPRFVFTFSHSAAKFPPGINDNCIDFAALVISTYHVRQTTRISRSHGAEQHLVKVFLLIPTRSEDASNSPSIIVMQTWCTHEEELAALNPSKSLHSSSIIGLLRPMSGPLIFLDLHYQRYDSRLKLHSVRWCVSKSRTVPGHRLLTQLKKAHSCRGLAQHPQYFFYKELERMQSWFESKELRKKQVSFLELMFLLV